MDNDKKYKGSPNLEHLKKEVAEKYFKDSGIIYLNDSGIEIEGTKFWGSPIQPWFHDWAFNRVRGEEIKRHWDLIPMDTDVLITHGPPFGLLDMCANGERVGCKDLLETIAKIRPRVHAFGHIHEKYGIARVDKTIFVNACCLNESYVPTHNPIDIEI